MYRRRVHLVITTNVVPKLERLMVSLHLILPLRKNLAALLSRELNLGSHGLQFTYRSLGHGGETTQKTYI